MLIARIGFLCEALEKNASGDSIVKMEHVGMSVFHENFT